MMRKFIVLIVTCLTLASCNIKVNDYTPICGELYVKSVEVSPDPKFKYKVAIESTRVGCTTTVLYYTDTNYSVGDKLTIVKTE